MTPPRELATHAEKIAWAKGANAERMRWLDWLYEAEPHVKDTAGPPPDFPKDSFYIVRDVR